MKAPRTKFNKVPRYGPGGVVGGYGDDYKLPGKPKGNAAAAWNTAGGLAYGAASMLDNSIASPIDVEGSDYFNSLAEKRKKVEKGVDTASSAVGMVPGVGTIIAGGMQLGKAIGKTTQDKFGVYKSKGAEIIDNSFDPVKHFQNFGNLWDHPTASNALNTFSLGILGKNSANEENKRQRDIYRDRSLAGQVASSDRAGSMNMNRLPAYQAPLYGRRGLRLRARATPSMNIPGRPSMRFTTKFGKK